MNSILLPGVRIGPNSIVGAGSVVTRDIPPDSVYAGNPARFICDTSTYLESCRLKNTGIIGSDEREEKLVKNFFGR
jgi:serine acetyltransferase